MTRYRAIGESRTRVSALPKQRLATGRRRHTIVCAGRLCTDVSVVVRTTRISRVSHFLVPKRSQVGVLIQTSARSGGYGNRTRRELLARHPSAPADPPFLCLVPARFCMLVELDLSPPTVGMSLHPAKEISSAAETEPRSLRPLVPCCRVKYARTGCTTHCFLLRAPDWNRTSFSAFSEPRTNHVCYRGNQRLRRGSNSPSLG